MPGDLAVVALRSCNVDRFQIVGSRTDARLLHVDIACKNSERESKALDALLETILEETGAKRVVSGSDDGQRYAFSKLLTQMLQFADESNFARFPPGKDRQKKLRELAKSVSAQLADIVQEHGRRKVVTLSFSTQGDKAALLKAIHKGLSKQSK
jgi:hypothetical protein